MASDMDFNGADTQDAAFDLIPANTLVKVCLTVRPGGAGISLRKRKKEIRLL